MVFVVGTASIAMAGDQTFVEQTKEVAKNTASGTKKVTKDVVNFTGNATNDSVKIVGNAAKGTGETLIAPFKKLWRWAKGEGRGQAIVTAPLNKAGETIKDATVNTAKMPIEAGNKTKSQR